ncbi:MAG TPA: Wzz/FepE/Etk N-terminal domain-containing protein, partial [Bacteroidia bacterium]|nr:Wzz/FepE/Etk N-terminal domain-containing protein [Bacteroidia bacterium]
MLQAQMNDRNETFDRYKERLTNFSVEFEFGLFLFIAKKSLIWIALLMFTACATSWLYLRYSQNYYEAATILQINIDNTSKVLNINSAFVEDINEVASAIEVIRSKVFLKRALTKLPLQISYYAEGR